VLRGARSLLPVVLLAAIFAVVTIYLIGEGGTRLRVALLGMVVVATGAYLSGNIRLFCLWGFILTLPFDLSYRFGPVFPKLGGETSFRFEVSDLFWVGLLAYLVRDLWTGVARGVRVPKITYFWVAIMLMGMAAVIAGPWRLTALHEVVRMLKIMVTFIVILNEMKTPERMMHVAAALAAAIVIQAAGGILQYATGSNFGLKILGEAEVVASATVVRAASVTRIGSFMIHPVIFATFLATTLPIAIALLFARTGRMRRLLFGAAILLGVPALVLTLSRAGWLTFAVASSITMLLIMLHPTLRRRVIIPVAGVGAVLVVVAIAFGGTIVSRSFGSTQESEKGRDEWKRDAVRMMSDKPVLGWGLNSYAFAVPPYTRLGARGAREFYEKAGFAGTKFIPVVHNAYLQWLAEIGAVGLLLHLAIFASLLWTAWRNLRVRNEFLFVLNAACLASVIGYLIDLLFGNSLRQGSTLREFWVLAALICAIHYWRLRHESPAEVPTVPPPTPLAPRLAGR
jgi:O-antigen ligase